MHNDSLLDAKANLTLDAREELLKFTYFAKTAILGPELFQIVTPILIAGRCT